MRFTRSQTRRLFLAGTVAFPMPFPGIGTVSIEKALLRLSSRRKRRGRSFVVVQEKQRRDQSVIRIIRMRDVSAIFFPGEYSRKGDPTSKFSFSDCDRVDDFDQGQWFLNGHINVETIRAGLNITVEEFTRRNSKARGVVFVPENRPVLSITEVTQTAGATSYEPLGWGCDCCD